jgi:hypothetical protein
MPCSSGDDDMPGLCPIDETALAVVQALQEDVVGRPRREAPVFLDAGPAKAHTRGALCAFMRSK